MLFPSSLCVCLPGFHRLPNIAKQMYVMLVLSWCIAIKDVITDSSGWFSLDAVGHCNFVGTDNSSRKEVL